MPIRSAMAPCATRNDGAADDGLNEQPGCLAGERAHVRRAQSEDAGEHDGVEETDQQDLMMATWPLVSMEVTTRQSGHNGERADGRAGANALQDGRHR